MSTCQVSKPLSEMFLQLLYDKHFPDPAKPFTNTQYVLSRKGKAVDLMSGDDDDDDLQWSMHDCDEVVYLWCIEHGICPVRFTSKAFAPVLYLDDADETAILKAKYARKAYETIFREELDHLEDGVEPCVQFEVTLWEIAKKYDDGRVWGLGGEECCVQAEPKPIILDGVRNERCKFFLDTLFLNIKEKKPAMEGLKMKDACPELVEMMNDRGALDFPEDVIINIYSLVEELRDAETIYF